MPHFTHQPPVLGSLGHPHCGQLVPNSGILMISRVNNSLQWHPELRKVLDLWLLFYYCKRIQIKTNQGQSHTGQGLRGFHIGNFLHLKGHITPSWHIDVWQRAEYCHPKKLTEALKSDICIGISLLRHLSKHLVMWLNWVSSVLPSPESGAITCLKAPNF